MCFFPICDYLQEVSSGSWPWIDDCTVMGLLSYHCSTTLHLSFRIRASYIPRPWAFGYLVTHCSLLTQWQTSELQWLKFVKGRACCKNKGKKMQLVPKLEPVNHSTADSAIPEGSGLKRDFFPWEISNMRINQSLWCCENKAFQPSRVCLAWHRLLQLRFPSVPYLHVNNATTNTINARGVLSVSTKKKKVYYDYNAKRCNSKRQSKGGGMWRIPPWSVAVY